MIRGIINFFIVKFMMLFRTNLIISDMLLIILILPLNNAFAQFVKELRGEYTYVIPKNMSRLEAEKTAVKQARLQAIADEFGTIISQNNFTKVNVKNTKTDTRFLSLMDSEVKGEWICDLTPPKTRIVYDEETDIMVMYAYVHGKAREIVTQKTDLILHVLCNGTDNSFESDVFKNGDRFYLSLRSPVDGYVAVYLADEADSVFCLLPYPEIKEIPIMAERNYVFFSKSKEHVQPPLKKECVKPLVLCTDKHEEMNTIYVIFSQKSFIKANADDSKREINGLKLPHSLSYKKFQKWLTGNRLKDTTMQVEEKVIKILNNND